MENKDLEKPPSKEEWSKILKDAQKESEENTKKHYQELVDKLSEKGSLELLAQIILMEIRAQNPIFHDATNPLSENPIGLFLSGLFLKYNNFDAEFVDPFLVYDVVDLASKYFDSFRIGLMTKGVVDQSDKSSLSFLSKQEKFMFDSNPRSFNFQKIDQVKSVFNNIDEFLIEKFGFNTNDALSFIDSIINTLEPAIRDKQKLGKEKFDQAVSQYNDPKNLEFRKSLEENGFKTVEEAAFYYADHCFLIGASKILTINIDEFCTLNKIERKKEFSNFINTLSCTFGEQTESFENPLDENMLSTKPFIKLDEKNFFCPLGTSLTPKLDFILENLLVDEKKNQTDVWGKYERAKSKFLEDKTFDFFSRVFPEKNMYRNLYYNVDGKRPETDLVIIFDNKILIVESKANYLPLAGRRGGIKTLESSLEKIIEKAYLQAKRTRDYIQSADEVVFEDKSGKEVLRVNSKNNDFQFFFINSTLETLDVFQANLKELDILKMFDENDYPWSVNLFDLDIITDCIQSVSYFLHYIHQRTETQKRGVFSVITEGEFLGWYFKYGNFYEYSFDAEGRKINRISIGADFFDQFEKYYVFNEKKPTIEIQPTLAELIKNLEKYHQKGFTDITNLLLDFPIYHRQIIGKKIKDKLKKIIVDGSPDGFFIAIPKPYDVGFSYFTSQTTTDFYKHAKKRMMLQKYKHKITKWAMIGRNYKDTKNFATFFYFIDESWKYDENVENDVPFISTNYFNM
ncbi:MAG: hypothetical protein K8Q89_10285 [Nitrosarchaeum sp.]|nr:hypothetical protein [Nitrosarchaeum sp.]